MFGYYESEGSALIGIEWRIVSNLFYECSKETQMNERFVVLN